MMNSSTIHQHERLDHRRFHNAVWTVEVGNWLILLGFMDRIVRRRQVARQLQIQGKGK